MGKRKHIAPTCRSQRLMDCNRSQMVMDTKKNKQTSSITISSSSSAQASTGRGVEMSASNHEMNEANDSEPISDVNQEMFDSNLSKVSCNLNEEAKQVLIDSLNEDYEKLRICHEQYYSKLNSCLSQYPGNQFVIEVVNSAKKIWIKDLELYNNTLRKECENVDKDAMVDLFIPVFVTNNRTRDEVIQQKQVNEDKFDLPFDQDSVDNDNMHDNLYASDFDLDFSVPSKDDIHVCKVAVHHDAQSGILKEDHVACPMLRKCSKSVLSKGKCKDVEAISVGSKIGEKEIVKHTRQKKYFFQKTCVSLPIVDVKSNLTDTDLELSESIFFAPSSPHDVIFQCEPLCIPRYVFESLVPGCPIYFGLIDTWSFYLNCFEKLNSVGSTKRVFFPTNIMFERRDISRDEIISHLDESYIKQEIVAQCLMFFPVRVKDFYLLICYNFMTNKCHILDNSDACNQSLERYNKLILWLNEFVIAFLNHKNYAKPIKISLEMTERIEVPWGTKANLLDSGIFLMRHMETYMGNGMAGFVTGFSKEGKSQEKQIRFLRLRYLRTMLLSEINTLKEKVEINLETYKELPEETKQLGRSCSLETIKSRIESVIKVEEHVMYG